MICIMFIITICWIRMIIIRIMTYSANIICMMPMVTFNMIMRST